MNNRVALHLAEILRSDGEEPYIHGGDGRLRQRLEARVTPDDWMEVNLIVHAMRAGIITELLLMRTEEPSEEQLEALVQRFTQRLAIQAELAEWVINAWAYALGLSAPAEQSAGTDEEAGSPCLDDETSAPEALATVTTDGQEATAVAVNEEAVSDPEEISGAEPATEIVVDTDSGDAAEQEVPSGEEEADEEPTFPQPVDASPRELLCQVPPPMARRSLDSTRSESARAGAYLALSLVLLLLLGISLQFWPEDKRLRGFTESATRSAVLNPVTPATEEPAIPPVISPVRLAERAESVETKQTMDGTDAQSPAAPPTTEDVAAAAPEKNEAPVGQESAKEPVAETVQAITDGTAKTRTTEGRALPPAEAAAEDRAQDEAEAARPVALEPAVHRIVIPQGRRTALTRIKYHMVWSDGRRERVYPRWKVIRGDGQITKYGFEPSGKGGDTVLTGYSSAGDVNFECELTVHEAGSKETESEAAPAKTEARQPAPAPAVADATTPATGSIVCTSSPRGASIAVDGKAMQGRTDIRVTDVPAGLRTVVLSLNGDKISRRVEVPPAGEVKVHVEFTPAQSGAAPLPSGQSETAAADSSEATTGVIDIRGNHPYAEVFLNGQPRGSGDLTFENLNPGTALVMIKRPGKTLQTSVDVRAGGYTILEVTDERIRVR